MNMTFPKNNKALTEMFRNARTPRPTEFEGKYYVEMLTVMPSFRRFGHRKHFYPDHDRTEGHNILFGREWGRFILEEGICEDMGSLGAVIINYDSDRNSFLTKRIRDYVRRLEEEKSYLGRFYYLFWGKLRFSGYFSLVKI
jgi:hypothetical protein